MSLGPWGVFRRAPKLEGATFTPAQVAWMIFVLGVVVGGLLISFFK